MDLSNICAYCTKVCIVIDYQKQYRLTSYNSVYRGCRDQGRFWLKIADSEGAKASRKVAISQVLFTDFSVDSFTENQYKTVSTLDLKEAKSVGEGSIQMHQAWARVKAAKILESLVCIEISQYYKEMTNHQHKLYRVSQNVRK